MKPAAQFKGVSFPAGQLLAPSVSELVARMSAATGECQTFDTPATRQDNGLWADPGEVLTKPALSFQAAAGPTAKSGSGALLRLDQPMGDFQFIGLGEKIGIQ